VRAGEHRYHSASDANFYSVPYTLGVKSFDGSTRPHRPPWRIFSNKRTTCGFASPRSWTRARYATRKSTAETPSSAIWVDTFRAIGALGRADRNRTPRSSLRGSLAEKPPSEMGYRIVVGPLIRLAEKYVSGQGMRMRAADRALLTGALAATRSVTLDLKNSLEQTTQLTASPSLPLRQRTTTFVALSNSRVRRRADPCCNNRLMEKKLHALFFPKSWQGLLRRPSSRQEQDETARELAFWIAWHC